MIERKYPAPAMGPCRVLLIVVGFALGLQAAAAPVPKGKPDKPGARGEIVDNWSLGLATGSDRMVEDFRHPTSVTVTLRNHAKKDRTRKEIQVPEGHPRSAKGLSYVVRFSDGTVVVVPNPSRGARFAAGVAPPHLPVEVGAGGKFEATHPTLNGLLFSNNREAREAFHKCNTFAVTVITTEGGLKLKSNTVFINGKFDLPKGHDPLADAKAYRAKKAKKRGK